MARTHEDWIIYMNKDSTAGTKNVIVQHRGISPHHIAQRNANTKVMPMEKPVSEGNDL